ncbi:MAG: 3'(2'),5'-bisphosphate nucleotidase [Candidatus Contendobacter odensis]|uniref:3'(2'),5'-bisphosphate nucleotidase CysQ n=1 Tax=Candidatus Contendibacter odensensis TaxID=1400860 RepID=A0A2G6PFZ0_9GAMM|nr:MAG: 3'(2'),5'-bisphosphate nucleotidase [Candidatus Contendobacter odensis]
MTKAPDIDLTALVEPVQAIARAAGRCIMDVYASSFSVTEKADQSPVTEADLAAHQCLLKGLADLTPDIPILSEEAPDICFAERSRWERLWLIDPLDGTREFIRRSDQFSINIALIHRHEAIFGLILSPVDGVCYHAWRGGGAYKRIRNQTIQPIQASHTCHQPVRITSSLASYRSRRLQDYLNDLGDYQHLFLGSALKSCWVAEGKADLYPRFGPTGEWDTAAAQIIVEEAGGQMTDMCLRPLRYNTRPILINPDFFAFGDINRNWSRYLPHYHPRRRMASLVQSTKQ